MARPGGRPAADQARSSPSGSKPSIGRSTVWPSALAAPTGVDHVGSPVRPRHLPGEDHLRGQRRHPVVGDGDGDRVGPRRLVGEGPRDVPGRRVDGQARRQARRRPDEAVAVGVGPGRGQPRRGAFGGRLAARVQDLRRPGWCRPPSRGTRRRRTTAGRRRRWPSPPRRGANRPRLRRRACPRSSRWPGRWTGPAAGPSADQVRGSPSGSEPAGARSTASPSAPCCGPGSATTGARLVSSTVQLKTVESVRLGARSSVTVRVTACGEAAAAS